MLKSMTINQLVVKARQMASDTQKEYLDLKEKVEVFGEVAGQFAELADNIEALLNNPSDTELHVLSGDD